MWAKVNSYGLTPILLAAVLMVFTLWLFWPATHYALTNLDDNGYVTENPMIQNGLTWPAIRHAFTTIYADYWVPLLWVSYMLDRALFGAGPFGYHLTNIVLHALNALLLFLLLNAATKRPWLSAFATALFAWHPLRVESVAWVTERKDVLSSFFLFLGFSAFAWHRMRSSPLAQALVGVFMVAGLLVKPMLVTFPVMLAIVDHWLATSQQEPKTIKDALRHLFLNRPFLWIIALVFAAITVYTQRRGGAMLSAEQAPLLTRLVAIPIAYIFYLTKTFWPHPLIVLYPELTVTFWRSALSTLLLLALTWAAFSARRWERAVFAGWLWFLVVLLPVIGLVRTGTVHVADRFMYVPAIGLAVALTWLVGRLATNQRRLAVAGACGLVILAACAWKTRVQLPVWKDSRSLYEHQLRHVPDCALAHNNLATGYLIPEGYYREALVHLEQAVKGIAQDKRRTYMGANLGMLLTMLDRPQEARRRLAALLEQYNPRCPHLNAAMGAACVESEDPDSAIRYFAKAIEEDPKETALYYEAIRACWEAGRMAEAADYAKRLNARNGDSIRTYSDLAAYYTLVWQKRDRAGAWRYFQRALKMDPHNARLLNNAAWLLATDAAAPAPPATAVGLAQKALDLVGPHVPAILDTLGAAYARNGQFDRALSYARQALTQAERQGQRDLAARIRERIAAYERGEPWTELPAPADWKGTAR